MVLSKANPRTPWRELPEPKSGPRRVVFFEAEEEGPHAWQTGAGRVAGYTARSPAKSTANEDALAVVEAADGSLILAVADGMGGQASGETAARLTIESVCDAVLEAGGDTDRLRAAIVDGIENANRAVVGLGNGAGATLAVVCVSEPFVRSFHVGDSAILVMGQRGKVKFESIAHSPVGYAEAAGILEPEDAVHHEERHLVSNFVGMEQMRIEIGPVLTLSRYDTLLVATDGLTDNLLVHEAVGTLRAGRLDRCAAALAALARERMQNEAPGLPSKPDDLTFLAFRRC